MISNLPTDILRLVLEKLDSTALGVASHVSKEWRSTALNINAGHALRASYVIDNFLVTEKQTRWAVANGLPLSAKLYAHAAQKGNIGVLCALRELRCPHDSRACLQAARNGHLPALLWMRKHNFFWNFLVCAEVSESKKHGAKLILKWLEKTKCPCKKTYHR